MKHTDVDLSSAEELAMFEAEKNNETKDIGDVGETYGAVAEEKGLTLKYKTSYWDEIPDWAKDDDGDWVVAYYGIMALLTNKIAKGYAKTVRDVELPAELEEKMIPDEQYQNIKMVEDQDAWEKTVAELPTL